ncbi:MAG: beta-lactamase family protein [Ekhidna sp.]|nr:beta-lactamase family protein [Ekhidna sp.]
MKTLLVLCVGVCTAFTTSYPGWRKVPDYPLFPVQNGNTSALFEKEIKLANEHLQSVPETLNVPSFSVAVGIDNKVVWSAAVGYADLRKQIPADVHTKYRVGSTSKAITATGVAKLVDQGLLNLDDSIGRKIPNYPVKRWDFATRQLLSHTAGVGNYRDFGISSWVVTLCNCKQYDSVTEGLNVFNDAKLLYRPGTDFAYSSFDVILASSLIEVYSNQPFLEYMEKEIFTPLEMDATLGDHSVPDISNLATFYRAKKNRYKEYKTLFGLSEVNLSYKWAGGGFLSTPSDLVKMGNAYLNDTTFLSRSTLKTFFTPQPLINGEVNEQEYALGWRSYYHYSREELLDGEETWIVHHGGVSKGSMNFLILFPEYNMVINASINARAEEFGHFSDQVYRLASIFLSELEKRDVSDIR